METHLALEIKVIDDQIAEQTKRMERKTGSRVSFCPNRL